MKKHHFLPICIDYVNADFHSLNAKIYLNPSEKRFSNKGSGGGEVSFLNLRMVLEFGISRLSVYQGS